MHCCPAFALLVARCSTFSVRLDYLRYQTLQKHIRSSSVDSHQQGAWPNGKALDYESRDCRFDPCRAHLFVCGQSSCFDRDVKGSFSLVLLPGFKIHAGRFAKILILGRRVVILPGKSVTTRVVLSTITRNTFCDSTPPLPPIFPILLCRYLAYIYAQVLEVHLEALWRRLYFDLDFEYSECLYLQCDNQTMQSVW
jgi:hypothetical protein